MEQIQLSLERDRLLASEQFARSPLMSGLLKYLVEQQLLDSGQPLTSEIIAAEALGKESTDGSDASTYARLQIGRLRQVMDSFYAKHGGTSRLQLPSGKYRFELIPTATETKTFVAVSPEIEISRDEKDSSAPHSIDRFKKLSGLASKSSDRTKIYYIGAAAVVLALAIYIFSR